MGKRSEFERVDKDYYRTPEKAAAYLRYLLPPAFTFIEPCAGDGALTDYIEKIGGECVYELDIDPKNPRITKGDAALHRYLKNGPKADFIITNPPWKFEMLAPLIRAFVEVAPTFLLLPADYASNLRMTPYIERCGLIMPIGRVKWIEGTTMSGFENAAWFLFINRWTWTQWMPRPAPVEIGPGFAAGIWRGIVKGLR